MLVGICEVNKRQYCAGVWPDIVSAQKQLDGVYRLTKVSDDDAVACRTHSPLASKASAIYDAEDLGTDSPLGHIGTDVDGFTLYEYTDAFPGFCPFDED